MVASVAEALARLGLSPAKSSQLREWVLGGESVYLSFEVQQRCDLVAFSPRRHASLASHHRHRSDASARAADAPTRPRTRSRTHGTLDVRVHAH